MSDTQTPESRETLSELQQSIKGMFKLLRELDGGEEVFQQLITAAVQQSNRELLLRLKKQAGTYFTESDGTFDYIPVEAIDDELAALERQQAGEEPTDDL